MIKHLVAVAGVLLATAAAAHNMIKHLACALVLLVTAASAAPVIAPSSPNLPPKEYDHPFAGEVKA